MVIFNISLARPLETVIKAILPCELLARDITQQVFWL